MNIIIPLEFGEKEDPIKYPKSPHPKSMKQRTAKRIEKSLLRGRGRSRLWYVLRWTDGTCSVEPCKKLVNCDRLLAEYHAQRKGTPGATWASRQLFPNRRYQHSLFKEWLTIKQQ